MSDRAIVVAAVRAAELSLAQGARELGCARGVLHRWVWTEVKFAILERDEACVVCGRVMPSMDVHHRLARGAGGTSRPEIAYGLANLVLLCRDDHRQTESSPDWARAAGLKLDHGSNPAQVRVMRHLRWVMLGADGSVEDIGAVA